MGRKILENEDPTKLMQAMGRVLSEAASTGMINGKKVFEGMEIDPKSIHFSGTYLTFFSSRLILHCLTGSFHYYLSGDDVNECEEGGTKECNPHDCLDLPSDFMCQCSEGFVLHEKNTHECVAIIPEVETTEESPVTRIEAETTEGPFKITTQVEEEITTHFDPCSQLTLDLDYDQSGTMRVTCELDTSNRANHHVRWLDRNSRDLELTNSTSQ